MRQIPAGITDYTRLIRIRDSATGQDKTGLTHTSIDISYTRVEVDNDVVCTDVTPASLSALTDAHSDWGFKEVSSTNAPGLYRLDIADAAFGFGARQSVITIRDAGSNNIEAVHLEFEIVHDSRVRFYVDGQHGNDSADGRTWITARATPKSAADSARSFPGSEIHVAPDVYSITGATVPDLFTIEQYTQVASFTESGSGGNTRFTKAGDGSEGYDQTLVGSRMIVESGSLAGSVYRITDASYVGPDWEFTVTPNFGGTYASNISGKTLRIDRQRADIGVSLIGGPGVVFDSSVNLNTHGTTVGVGLYSTVSGIRFRSNVASGTYWAGVGCNATFQGILNYGQHGAHSWQGEYLACESGADSDFIYDSYTGSEAGIVRLKELTGATKWDFVRFFSANQTVQIDGGVFGATGPTSISGVTEARGIASTGSRVYVSNAVVFAENATGIGSAVFGPITILGGTQLRSTGNGTNYDINAAGSTVYVSGGNYDPTKTTGIVSVIPTQSVNVTTAAVTSIQSGLATAANVAAVETDTQDIQSRLPAALVGGRIDSYTGAMASNVVNAAALASDAGDEIRTGLATATALSSVASDLTAIGVLATAINSKTTNLPAAFPTNFANLLINVSGEVTAENAGAGTGGSGARSVTITVNDGTNPLTNATVRLSSTIWGQTNGSGQIVFSVDDGTYTVRITKAGHTFTPTSLVVDGDETRTYSMTLVVITPPDEPEQTTAFLTTHDGQGNVAGGVELSFKLISTPGDDGYSYDRAPFTATSDATTGLLTVSLRRQSVYIVTRGSGDELQITTPDAATYELPEVLGYD